MKTTPGRLSIAALALIACAHAPETVPAPAAPATKTAEKESAAEPAPPVPEVVALPAPTHPTVSFRILFRAGSVDDPPGREGATALAAALMAQGGTDKLTSAELLRTLYPMAADLDVQSDKEMTVFTGHVHKDHLSTFLPLLIDVVAHPRWDAAELDRVRDDFVNDVERRLRTSDDENLGKEALASVLYAGHPYGHYTGGTVAGLKAVTLPELKAHAANVFNRSRLMIGIAGGYSDASVAALERGLSALPAGDAERPRCRVATPATPPEPKAILVEKEAASTAVSIGHGWELSRRQEEYPAMVVAMSAFGEHRQFNGRLMRELRGIRGLNYGDYSYVESFVQEGGATFVLPNIARSHQFFSIWIRPVENKNRAFAIRAALYEVDKLLKGGFGEDEVERTKKFLAGYTVLFTQTDSRRLGYAMDDRFYQTPDFQNRLRERIARVTTAQVNAAVRKWIKPQELRIAVVTKDAAGLARQMVANAPSPIHYDAARPTAVTDEDQVIEKYPFGVAGGDVRTIPVEELFQK